MADKQLIPIEVIEKHIYLIRGEKVMLDFHLAELYGVEYANLKSQIVTSSWGGIRRAMPYAFTEQGGAMPSSVPKSRRAVQVNIQIMRAFVRLGKFLLVHKELAAKLRELEPKYEEHDEQIKAIFEAIRRLLEPAEKPRRQIGLRVEEPRVFYRVKRHKKR